jgi:AcrR family transcriptional regulator
MARNPQQTRDRLLQSAFQEIHARGFQGMRVDEVLKQAGLQKGAFYHHFSSKTELGYAVLEEQIAPLLEDIWLLPLEGIEDPVIELPELWQTLGERIPTAMATYGCPLNNLAQEMSTQDEGFHERIENIFTLWVNAYTRLFEQAKVNAHVRENIDAEAVARFLVASLEGCIGLAKVGQPEKQWQACLSQLSVYLQSLR